MSALWKFILAVFEWLTGGTRERSQREQLRMALDQIDQSYKEISTLRGQINRMEKRLVELEDLLMASQRRILVLERQGCDVENCERRKPLAVQT